MTDAAAELGPEWDELRGDYPDWCFHRGAHGRSRWGNLSVWAHPGPTPPDYGIVRSAETGLVGEVAGSTPEALRTRIERQVKLRAAHGYAT